MPLFKKIAVFGATSGIGKALAERCVQDGSFVIAIGRRKENLDTLVETFGSHKVESTAFDITKLDAIPDFVSKLTDSHEDLDCVLLNSGIQRSFNFAKPETVDMNIVQEELVTNYLSQVALTQAFLPFLMSRKTQTTLMYTTSGLALTPMMRVPNYCASKAAMHHFILSLRLQLQDSKVKVVELIPPAVQTELHDAKHQPDLKDAGPIGIPLEEYTDKVSRIVQASVLIAYGLTHLDLGWSKER